MVDRGIKILIWDRDIDPPAWEGIVLLWKSFSVAHTNHYSIPAMLELNAEDLRTKYLEFIYDFGESNQKGRTLIERLELQSGLTYWWMTLIAQKDVIQYSPHIYDILKLWVAEDLLKTIKIEEIVVESNRNYLIEVLREWSEEQKFNFHSPNHFSVRFQMFIERCKYLKPIILLQAFIVFCKYVVPRFRLIRPITTKSGQDNCKMVIVDVLTHLDHKSLDNGRFASKYWTVLVDYLYENKIAVSWLHWYYKHKTVPKISIARKLTTQFNRNKFNHIHILGDSFVYPEQCWAVIKNFIKLNRLASAITNLQNISKANGSNIKMWPILKMDWYRSFLGVHSVLNLFFIEQISFFVNRLPKQSLGIYIQENQPWEYILSNIWKQQGHGLLIGVAHTTIPFLDFRYFFDPRTFFSKSEQPPLPDFMAVNGPDAFHKMISSKFPKSKIKQLEALRYMHLNLFERKIRINKKVLNVLVVGDLLPEITNSQIRFLLDCVNEYKIAANIIFKPHPASNSVPNELLLDMTVSNRTIGEELIDCDLVFVNNVTSGAADPYHIGIPVIVQNVGVGINFSPLFKLEGVFFVSTKAEFIQAFRHVVNNKNISQNIFFNIDKDIPLWRDLIKDTLLS